jgi:MFS family permease
VSALPDGAPEQGGTETPGRRIIGLDRNVFFAGLVSFFMDVSSEMVYPLVPVFLSSVLGVNKAVIGLIEGVAESTASLLKLGSGWLSDRLGRRKALMEVGYGTSALSRVGLALAGTWVQVLMVRFVDRFGKGVRTAPRDAIVAESSSPAELGRSFGFHRAMDQFGAVVGPGLAFLFLAASPGAYRTVFLLSVIPGLIAVLIIVLFIQERRRPRALPASPMLEDRGRPSWPERLRSLRGPLLNYVLITALFSLGNSSDAFLILRAGDLGIAAALIPVVYMTFNLVYSGLSVPAGLLADRIGRRLMAVLGYLVFAATYAGMAMAGSALTAWAMFLAYGVYMGVSDGNGRALLAQLSPPDRAGTAFGVYHAALGLAALPASIVAGLLWERVSPAAPFWVGAGAGVTAALLLLIFVPEKAGHRVAA